MSLKAAAVAFSVSPATAPAGSSRLRSDSSRLRSTEELAEVELGNLPLGAVITHDN